MEREENVLAVCGGAAAVSELVGLASLLGLVRQRFDPRPTYTEDSKNRILLSIYCEGMRSIRLLLIPMGANTVKVDTSSPSSSPQDVKAV